MQYLYTFLGWIMNWSYGICKNYGLAIILFTFISKIVLLPVSLWTYFNSIKMVKIQPDIYMIKVRYYGQPDTIAEEQAKLFKENKYRPLASTIPTIVQLVLLMGVVGVIRQGINDPTIDMSFGPVNLGQVPSREGIRLLWSLIIAGISAWILCIAQNASNVLQSEQSRFNKYGTTILSVGLSLYLGWFVFVGTAFYWVCSNLMAVLQMYILNWIIKPRPKTDDSDRYVMLPPFVLDQIGSGTGRIIDINPNTVTKQFIKYRNKLGLSLTFHDLRHFFASTASVLGIPDIYTADMGGWDRNSAAMKSIYQNNITSMSEYYAKKLNNHLSGIIKEDAN